VVPRLTAAEDDGRIRSWAFFMSSNKLFIAFGLLVATLQPAWALRIVSLLPSNTEILESIGAGSDVVGVTRYDGMLKRRKDVTPVGDLMTPNMEQIISLQPDVIVAGYWTSSHIVPRLRKLGFDVLEIRNPRTLEEMYGTIRQLAKAARRPEAAERVIGDLKNNFDRLRNRAARLPRRSIYIEIDRPYWTIGGVDFLSEALGVAGCDNIFSDIKRPAAQVTPEMIVQRDPEVIIAFKSGRAEIASRAGWTTIRAVKSGRVWDDLPEDALSRPGPALPVGLEALIKRLEQAVSK
jgi:iron complex transport system substrate-binding protein